jgi:hypothetical protein
MNRRIAVLAVALMVVASPLAAGTDKIIKSGNGSCQLSVPADWALGSLPGMANSPDKKMSVVVGSPKMIDSFTELKKTARTTYANSKVTKDTASEYEMEGRSITDKPDVYRAVAVSGSTFCIAEVMFTGAPSDDGRKIVETLKAAK